MNLTLRENLISDEFVELNEELHGRNPKYGGGNNYRWLDSISKLVNEYDLTNILDYGSGKGKFKRFAVPPKFPSHTVIREYDPAIEGKREVPCFEYDLVVCTDVLEHVEQEKLLGVVNHLSQCTGKFLFLTVALREGKKKLSNGMPAHINVQPPEFWRTLVYIYFTGFDINVSITNTSNGKHKDIVFVCRKLTYI